MTYQHIARPLERLEDVVKKVHDTRNYSLRIEYSSNDEIGKLASAFNEMLLRARGGPRAGKLGPP